MYKSAAEYIKSKVNLQPKVGIIFGTGLGSVAELIENPVYIPYTEVPNFPVSTVEGHIGRFIFGRINNCDVLAMQGRVHFYEGYSMEQLAMPIRTMYALGVEKVIVTNASGAINGDYSPGDIVIIKDHIKFITDSPLRGKNHDELGERFFDMTTAYSPRLIGMARTFADELGIKLNEGVYAYMGGPQFETPAEIKMLRILGADLVGMSTVPEVITAVHCGIEVLGLSCVTNMAAGMENGGLNREVIDKAEKDLEKNLGMLIEKVVEKI